MVGDLWQYFFKSKTKKSVISNIIPLITILSIFPDAPVCLNTSVFKTLLMYKTDLAALGPWACPGIFHSSKESSTSGRVFWHDNGMQGQTHG
jgi:hypothetical protein